MANFVDPSNRMRGFSLIEVLVSVVLLMVIGLGSVAIIAKTKEAQRDNATQSLVLAQIRNLMSIADATNCAGGTSTTIGSAAHQLAINCTRVSSNFTVSGVPSSGSAFSNVTVQITRPEVATSSTDAGTLQFIKAPMEVRP